MAAAETSQLGAAALDRAGIDGNDMSKAPNELPDTAVLGIEHGEAVLALNCHQTTGSSLNSSAALRFSVGNGVVLTIATDASLEQEQVGTAAAAQSSPTASAAALACDELTRGDRADGIYEHGTIAWTGSTIWAAAEPLARHLTRLDVRTMTGKDWGKTSVCELGYARNFSV